MLGRAPAADHQTRGASHWLPPKRSVWAPCSSQPRPRPLPREAAAAAPHSSPSHPLQPQQPGRSLRGPHMLGKSPLWLLSGQDPARWMVTWAPVRGFLPSARGAPWLQRTWAGEEAPAACQHPPSLGGTPRLCGMNMAACEGPWAAEAFGPPSLPLGKGLSHPAAENTVPSWRRS